MDIGAAVVSNPFANPLLENLVTRMDGNIFAVREKTFFFTLWAPERYPHQSLPRLFL